jgi:hypothetical protein
MGDGVGAIAGMGRGGDDALGSDQLFRSIQYSGGRHAER